MGDWFMERISAPVPLPKECVKEESRMVDFKGVMDRIKERKEKRNEEFHLIVAGGRHFSNYVLMCRELDKLLVNKKETHRIVIVSGAARGADKLGERYAEERGYEIDSHPADWERYGKSAGYRRNEEMAFDADALVAFWDGVSKGTNHMINIAKDHDLAIRVIRY